jgi:hypothetical protein
LGFPYHEGSAQPLMPDLRLIVEICETIKLPLPSGLSCVRVCVFFVISFAPALCLVFSAEWRMNARRLFCPRTMRCSIRIRCSMPPSSHSAPKYSKYVLPQTPIQKYTIFTSNEYLDIHASRTRVTLGEPVHDNFRPA